ncbi:unnamed protein product [Ixodes pacificus]
MGRRSVVEGGKLALEAGQLKLLPVVLTLSVTITASIRSARARPSGAHRRFLPHFGACWVLYIGRRLHLQHTLALVVLEKTVVSGFRVTRGEAKLLRRLFPQIGDVGPRPCELGPAWISFREG